MFTALSIRPATTEDLVALTTLAVQTFRDTFADDNNEADMAAYLRDSLSTKALQTELADENNIFLLAIATNQTAPIGYAKLHIGPAEPGITGPAPIELARLYVNKPAIGHGVGAKLMQACLDEAAAKGYETVWLGVWEHNLRALRFYQRWGFQQVGSHVFQFGADAQTDWLMQLSLVPSA